MPTAAAATFDFFASTAPGLESITAGELKLLGMRGRQEVGGVAFAGDLEQLYRANLWLRTASRVVVRLGRFHASTFYELERRAKKLPWQAFLPQAGSVAVRATCRKSRLYHSDAVAERVLAAIARVAPPGVEIKATNGSEEMDDETEETGSSQLFIVRIVHDEVEVSADSSGELLHRRGYRKEVAKAPLRETLAAAMLLASGWEKGETLLDPLCGSGTIPIEAAMLARGIAPGLRREFQFMRWPGFAESVWTRIVDEARQSVTSPVLDVRGGDRDAGAIEAAKRNADRAGVGSDIAFSAQSLSASLEALAGPVGERVLIVTNPPYGVRVGNDRELRDLYAAMGNAVAGRSGRRIGLLTSDRALTAQLRIPLRSRFDSQNGGIPVSFFVSESSKGAKVSRPGKVAGAKPPRSAKEVESVDGH